MAKKKGKRGRPKVLASPAQREVVLSTLSDGGSLADAAGMAGIHYHTLNNECKRDLAFAAQVKQAELKGKVSCIKDVKARKPEFLLERKWWKEFGRRSPDQISIGQVLAIICPAFTEVIQKVPAEDRQWCLERIELLIEKLRLKGKEE